MLGLMLATHDWWRVSESPPRFAKDLEYVLESKMLSGNDATTTEQLRRGVDAEDASGVNGATHPRRVATSSGAAEHGSTYL